ncbi:MAG: HslU--HslV peptidase ATPase subunit, partial [Alteromonadaceae bacterium]|nr:HslU--HslV peptidase ATPase subunit [Alteromonadaceae bacterium]
NFTPDGLRRIAQSAGQVNEGTGNVGARRLHTVMERLLEEASFKGGDMDSPLTIDADYVNAQLGELAVDEDLSRYIL